MEMWLLMTNLLPMLFNVFMGYIKIQQNISADKNLCHNTMYDVTNNHSFLYH